MSLTHTESDARIVARQLGRPPRGRWAVARRCHLGVPMAIESHPVLEDGAPFPTLFWLTCPLLIKRAGTLEARGRMNELNQLLASRDDMHKRVGEAVDRLKERRDSYAVIEDTGSPPGGGPDRIKCLHAHLAHELSDPPNPVGALTLAETGWPDCRITCVEVEE
ncbi:MAG TPA: DUF501 domain-containing protein [Actinomycetota bacterium]|nr:DUF501 domain-containing protein [Actinomycetota bacterium]